MIGMAGAAIGGALFDLFRIDLEPGALAVALDDLVSAALGIAPIASDLVCSEYPYNIASCSGHQNQHGGSFSMQWTRGQTW